MLSHTFPLRFFRFGALAFILGAGASLARAQTPILRWAFDQGKGAPVSSNWISGGKLAIQGDQIGYVAFQPSGGVSRATPGVLNAAANVYGDAGAAQVTSAGSPLLAEAELPQFVVTMWIKPTVPPIDQLYARLLIISPEEDEKAKTNGLFVAMHTGNLEVGVNGNATALSLGASAILPGEWTFVAIAYDGFATNPYFSPEMQAKFKTDRNCAVFIGGVESAAALVGALGINKGAPGYDKPAGPVSLNGHVVSIGSSTSNRARAFCGLIDDVRIYSGLLKPEQIEAVRRSALDVP